MKHTFWILVAGIILAVLMSNSAGRGIVAGPATTAPGESGQFCGSTGCHSSGAFFPELDILVHDQNGLEVDEYIPGDEYSVSVVVNRVGFPSRYGFQMVSLKNADNSAINNFIDIPDFAHEIELMGRQYVEHDMPLFFDSIPLSWLGPEPGTGDVVFYAAGNAVNGNGSPSGDGADTTRIVLKEALMSSTSELNQNQVSVYPNPTQGTVNISIDNKLAIVRILHLNGQLIMESQKTRIDISRLAKGMYILVIEDETGSSDITKLMKY